VENDLRTGGGRSPKVDRSFSRADAGRAGKGGAERRVTATAEDGTGRKVIEIQGVGVSPHRGQGELS
jgi:hypothetical protein